MWQKGQIHPSAPPPAQSNWIPYHPWEGDAKSTNSSQVNYADSNNLWAGWKRMPAEGTTKPWALRVPLTCVPGTVSASFVAPVAQLEALCLSVQAPRLLQSKETMGKEDTFSWFTAVSVTRDTLKYQRTIIGPEWQGVGQTRTHTQQNGIEIRGSVFSHQLYYVCYIARTL